MITKRKKENRWRIAKKGESIDLERVVRFSLSEKLASISILYQPKLGHYSSAQLFMWPMNVGQKNICTWTLVVEL